MEVVKELLAAEKRLLSANSNRFDYLAKEFLIIQSIMNKPYEELEKEKREYFDFLNSSLEKNDMKSIYDYDTKKLFEMNKNIIIIVQKNIGKLNAIKEDKTNENKRLNNEYQNNLRKIKLLQRLEKKLPEKAKKDAETLHYRDDILDRERKIGNDIKDYIWVNQQRIDEVNKLDNEYAKLLKELAWQNEVFSHILDQKNMNLSYRLRKTFKRPQDMPDIFKKLKESILREFSAIEELKRHYKTGVEDEKLKDIIVQEEKLISIINDFVLFLRIFEIPKVSFPSFNFCTFLTEKEQIKKFSQERFFSSSEYRTHNFKLAGRIFMVNEYTLPINENYKNFLGGKKESAVVLPVEFAIQNHFFLLKEKKEVVLLFTLLDKETEISKLTKDLALFDKIVKESDVLFENWFKETFPLSEKFRVEFKPTAKNIIYDNFTKRWVKDEAELFRENNATSLDFVDFITEMDWINRIDKKLEEKYEGKEWEEKVKPKDFLEEFLKLNLDGFKRIVMRAKNFYKLCLDDAIFFIRNSSPLISLDYGIVVLHRSKVLEMEKYWISINYRPKYVYYYHSTDLDSGIKSCFKECKKNILKKRIPKTKFLKIFSLPSFRKMECYGFIK